MPSLLLCPTIIAVGLIGFTKEEEEEEEEEEDEDEDEDEDEYENGALVILPSNVAIHNHQITCSAVLNVSYVLSLAT